MNEFIEAFRNNLNTWGELAEVVLNALSLLCIVAGMILSILRSVQDRQRNPGLHPMHTSFRRTFGGWLVVALEFQLAADIVGTIISPTTTHLVDLGAIALIRTLLNYFLSKELREEDEVLRSRVEVKSVIASK